MNEELTEIAYKAAKDGDIEAQIYLADINKTTRPTVSIKWYTEAAEQGDMNAQFKIGEMYFLGSGVSTNRRKAVEWWYKAARQGHIRAQFEIGVILHEGTILDKNGEESMRWLHKAARAEYMDAQFYLGRIYHEKGKNDVTNRLESYVEAVKLYRKAAEQGHVEAAYYVGVIYSMDNCNYHSLSAGDINEDAIYWFQKAAILGDNKSKFRLSKYSLDNQ